MHLWRSTVKEELKLRYSDVPNETLHRDRPKITITRITRNTRNSTGELVADELKQKRNSTQTLCGFGSEILGV